MIGPVSGTGRAMMASLQQAVQKGMPPDQAIQYVKSMATQGVAPMTDLYAMMNQFQRLKQPQAQAPQTPPTIKDQLNMMEQQQRMQSGIAGMQAPAPAAQPMDRGLGAIDAGRMEYPQFAGGGIVAFANGGTAGIDFSEMTDEQLTMLYEDKNVDVEARRAALKERLNRSGYARPEQLLERLGYTPEYFKRAFYDPSTAINFEMTGGAPAYMKDEQGRIRTPGMGGPVTYSLTEGVIPAKRPAATPAVTPTQSAAPTGTAVTPYSSPQAAGAAFDLAAAKSREGVRQDVVPARPNSGMVARAGASARGGDRYAELRRGVEERKFEEIADTFSPEERKRLDKALAGLTAEKKDAIRMSLAEAGFRWAAASSRGGRERTTALGALSEGAIGGMQQYRAAQKELRQTERELGREMAELRKYQDQVARGERTAKRDFEEKKQRDILDLEKQAEQIRQFNAQLAENRRSAELQYGGREALEKYRTSTVAVDALKAQLEDARQNVKNLQISFAKPEQIAAAEAEVARIRGMLGQFAGGGSGVPLTGGSRQYPGFTATTLP